MSKLSGQPVLSGADVSALFRLVHELRELGADPFGWRDHLARELAELCGARMVCAIELGLKVLPDEGPQLQSCGEAVVHVAESVQGMSRSEALAFRHDVFHMPNHLDPAHCRIRDLYGKAFTRTRSELVPDDEWYQSTAANERMKPHDCDDYIKSMQPVFVPNRGRLLDCIMVYRGWREPTFSMRERSFIMLLHEQLAQDWSRALEQYALPRRLTQTLQLLERGLSEKQAAAELEISAHTLHQYVKELYKRFGVQSRGELHAELARRALRYPKLASEVEAVEAVAGRVA